MKYVTKMKKWMCVVLAVVICGSFTGSVLAASVSWQSNGTYYEGYVNISGSATREKVFGSTYHNGTTGKATILTGGTVVTKTMEDSDSFPSVYKPHLNLALNNAGMQSSMSIILTDTQVTWKNSDPVGYYDLSILFSGGYGTWGVLQATSGDGTYMHVSSGTYSFAPSSVTAQVILTYQQ